LLDSLINFLGPLQWLLRAQDETVQCTKQVLTFFLQEVGALLI